ISNIHLFSIFTISPPPRSTLFPYTTLFRSLSAQPEIDKNHLGAIGYCMGGSFAVAWASTDSRLKAIAPYYWMRPMPPRNCHPYRSEEHTSELQSRSDLVCRLLLEKKKKKNK